MISIKQAQRYCKEDISLIENYDKAVNDITQTWLIHHRDEIKTLPSGIRVVRTRQELKDNDRYYNCPANELIFLTKEEHNKIHCCGFKHTNTHNNNISSGMKCHKCTEECRRKMAEARKLYWLNKRKS